MKESGIKPVIPPKSNRTATIRYSKRLYRKRNWIERVLGHLKINRAIACANTQHTRIGATSFAGVSSCVGLGTGRCYASYIFANSRRS